MHVFFHLKKKKNTQTLKDFFFFKLCIFTWSISWIRNKILPIYILDLEFSLDTMTGKMSSISLRLNSWSSCLIHGFPRHQTCFLFLHFPSWPPFTQFPKSETWKWHTTPSFPHPSTSNQQMLSTLPPKLFINLPIDHPFCLNWHSYPTSPRLLSSPFY